jgi:chemotaxis protein MotB
MANANDGAIIVKRIKKSSHGGHHGGAWKVAYADFVTAMMAFFLLMWLINTTTPEQKRGIADYFAAQSISTTSSGAGGVLGGTVLGQAAQRAGGAASFTANSPPTPPATPTRAKDEGTHAASSAAASGQTSDSQEPSDDHLSRMAPSSRDEQFASAAESIRQAMQEMPDIAALSRQVIMDETPEGLRIQLVDQDGKPMFAPGSSEPLPYTKKLLAVIAGIIDRLPNRISISGHTDAEPADTNSTSNWQLSAARAEAARAIITAAGISNDRIYEVSGRAGSEPLLPEDPSASANRRLSILLMKEAPPIPLGHKL